MLMLKEVAPAEYGFIKGRGGKTRSRWNPQESCVPTREHRREAAKWAQLLSPLNR